MTKIDTAGLRQRVDLVELISRYVILRRRGAEFVGLCPFHDERTPSFTVVPRRGFFHCFGCGAHGDAVAFLQAQLGMTFLEACAALGSPETLPRPRVQRRASPPPALSTWVPLMPVPADAPPLVRDGVVDMWNPRRSRRWRCRPERTDAYRNAEGQLLGYVLRIPTEGGKITPQVTFCVGPDGQRRWCTVPFPPLRPLQGLDDLAIRREAPVIIVEGEKCRAVAARALPELVALAWPGGAQGLRRVDFSPLYRRHVLLWPDADEAGRRAMLGFVDYTGLCREGVAQYAHAAGALAIQFIDPGARRAGWDIADAVDVDGWSGSQLRAWMDSRLIDVDIKPAWRMAA